MPWRSQENYFDDFWLVELTEVVSGDARVQSILGDTGVGVGTKKISQFFLNDLLNVLMYYK